MNKCPICGQNYGAAPALSRKDNSTRICPICATREALNDAGLWKDGELCEGILRTVSMGYADKGISVPVPNAGGGAR